MRAAGGGRPPTGGVAATRSAAAERARCPVRGALDGPASPGGPAPLDRDAGLAAAVLGGDRVLPAELGGTAHHHQVARAGTQVVGGALVVVVDVAVAAGPQEP